MTGTHSYSTLSRELLENVLDMRDGRYPSKEFGELRVRIVWDRLAGTIRARKGSRQLAIANAGTIPDRGLYAVTLPDGRRVGELDEEMVYEARPGQAFLLGASTWWIEEIDHDPTAPPHASQATRDSSRRTLAGVQAGDGPACAPRLPVCPGRGVGGDCGSDKAR